MGPRRVPRNDLAPADRRSRCGQMHHEPRLDPGYLGCDRTQRARGLLALERAGFCVQRGGRKIYPLGAGAINDRKPCNQTSKQSAGKYIPSNVITTTFVTCLVYLNTYTLLDYKKRVERSKRGSSLALPLVTFSEPTSPSSQQKPARRRRVIDRGLRDAQNDGDKRRTCLSIYSFAQRHR